jgi:hypothetical protein
MAYAPLVLALLAFAGSSALAIWVQVGRSYRPNLSFAALALFVCGLAAVVSALSFNTNTLGVHIHPDRHLHGKFGSRSF